jgi:hypothetical protein
VIDPIRVEASDIGRIVTNGKIIRPRSTRVHLAIPVFIYGNTDSNKPFKEITQTVEVNANGCLIDLATHVMKEQQLLLTNMKSNEEIPCHVVTLGNIVNGKAQVGLRFTQASPRFWGLAFPPEDWDPAERKRPMPSKR